jgi:hypothetical protein
MISYSFVTILDTPSVENPNTNVKSPPHTFSIKIGSSYGTQTLLDLGCLSQSRLTTYTIQTFARSDQSTLIFESFQNPFDFFNEITSVFIGVLSYQLYKLLQYTKNKRNWGSNKSLVRSTIALNPGISLRGLSRESGLAMGSTQYWIRVLTQEKELEIINFGKSNHYFTRDHDYSSNEKLLYSLRQNKRIYEILRVLNDIPEIKTQKDLCHELGFNKSLLSYYIKILKTHKIVESETNNLQISEEFKIFFDN